MILDDRLEFADALALNTGAAGSYLIGDVIDLTTTNIDIGQGYTLSLVISVDTAVTSGGAGTAQFSLCSDAQAAIAVDGSQTIHYQSRAFALAAMTAGATLVATRLPISDYERYLGIVQTTAVAALTGGKINAFLTADVAKVKHYADAVN